MKLYDFVKFWLENLIPSCFWVFLGDYTLKRFIKSKRTDSSDIPTLNFDGKIIVSDVDKAQCLNNYFVSTFTVENQDSFQAKVKLFPDMPDILVTEQGVLKLLSSLDTKKSLGPDNLSPLVLKEARNVITGILTLHLQSIFVIEASTGRLASGKCFSSA